MLNTGTSTIAVRREWRRTKNVVVDVDESEQEILDWAWGPDPMWPTEDWDLIATAEWTADLLLRLAADSECPNQDFFVRCLYLLAGDAVRSGFRACRKDKLLELIGSASTQPHPWPRQWAEDTTELIADPESFNYHEWCEGGIARRVVRPT